MKTHELAKALGTLSKFLKSMPNQDVSELTSISPKTSGSQNQSVGISLSVLASLSKFQKGDWYAVIDEFNLPIEIRPRDASRDIMGKIISYLAENERERERVATQSQVAGREGSELSSALRFLLSNE